MKKQTRDKSIDMLRGIGIIIVVLGHSFQVSLNKWDNSYVWEMIKIFQMPFMFYVSGMTLNFEKSDINPIYFIWKKIKRLGVPYIAWTTMYFILMIKIGLRQEFSFREYLLELGTTQFWFLRVLLCFYLFEGMAYAIKFLVCFKIKKEYVFDLLQIGLIPLVRGCSDLILGDITNVHFMYFVMGYFFYKYKDIIFVFVNRVNYKKRALMSSGVLGGVIILGKIGVNNVSFTRFAIVVAITVCVISFEGSNHITMSIEKMGRNTLPIYAIHWCLLFSIPWRMGIYSKFNLFPYYVRALLTWLLWLILCCLIVKILNRTSTLKKLFM